VFDSELRLIGVDVSVEYESAVKATLEFDRRIKVEREEKKRVEADLSTHEHQGEHFYFIAGYTSGGAPYGVTREEMEGSRQGQYYAEKLSF
jgi:hypothetical protein